MPLRHCAHAHTTPVSAGNTKLLLNSQKALHAALILTLTCLVVPPASAAYIKNSLNVASSHAAVQWSDRVAVPCPELKMQLQEVKKELAEAKEAKENVTRADRKQPSKLYFDPLVAKQATVRGFDIEDEREYITHKPVIDVRPSKLRMSLRNRPGDETILTVVFSVVAKTEFIQFVMPQNFQFLQEKEHGQELPCGAFGDKAEADRPRPLESSVPMRPLVDYISSCTQKSSTSAHKFINAEWSSSMVKESKMSLVFNTKPSMHGLSEFRHKENVTQEEIDKENRELHWWYFRIKVWTPRHNLGKEENKYQLHFWSTRADGGVDWSSENYIPGYEILGDWDCMYSEWEEWSTCSALCGGGLERRGRRIMRQPPVDGTGDACHEQLLLGATAEGTHTDTGDRAQCFKQGSNNLIEDCRPCNFGEDHKCDFRCKVEDGHPIKGVCSAECGGGWRTVRQTKISPAGCPFPESREVTTEECNTHACTPRCILADEWTVLSECSAVCGPGTFWMFRQVMQKEEDDPTCQPEWRQVKCEKRSCPGGIAEGTFLLGGDDRNMKAYVDDVYQLVVIFRLPSRTSRIVLTAPPACDAHEAFTFHELKLLQHNFHPYDTMMVVEQGAQINELVIRFGIPLSPTIKGACLESSCADVDTGLHHFVIRVKNPQCAVSATSGWVIDELTGDIACRKTPESSANTWELKFLDEATGSIRVATAPSYPLYAPPGIATAAIEKIYSSEEASSHWPFTGWGRPKRPEVAQDTGKDERERRIFTRHKRPLFCTERLGCTDGSECNADFGLCQPRKK